MTALVGALMRQSTAPLPREFLPRLQTDDQRRRGENIERYSHADHLHCACVPLLS